MVTPIEPLNLSLARADAAQQVQNLFAQADRAGRAAAAQEGQESARKDASAVPAADAAEGSKIREDESGGTGGGGQEPAEREPEAVKEPPPADAEGKGRRIDIKA